MRHFQYLTLRDFILSIISIVILISIFGGFLMYILKITQTKNTEKSTVNNQTPTPSITTIPKPFLIKGSIPYWDQEEAIKSFEENVSVFNYVNLFWYFLGSDGSVMKYTYANEDQSIIDFAHANNVKVSAVITNLPEGSGSWSSKREKNVISNEEVRQKHIENIVEKLEEFNFDGVIIDYELLKPNTREEYSNFIRELSQALYRENKILTVVLHPKTGEKVKGEEISAYQDWEALSKYSDQLQIMGYSEHTDEDPPGPIAGVDWIEKIIEYAKSKNIALEKLFLGIPLYGYDWNKNSSFPAKGLTFANVQNLLAIYNVSEEWDEKSDSPHFDYGTSHEVWFENARSVEEKIKLAKESGLAGVTFWRLGGEDPKIWEIVKKYRLP